jgi:Bromodomain
VQAPAPKAIKRKRVQKQQLEIPDAWTQKGMRVLDEIQRQPNAEWFSVPVQPTETFVPDYYKIVSQPMDLGTVRDKLRNGLYHEASDFEKARAHRPIPVPRLAADLRLRVRGKCLPYMLASRPVLMLLCAPARRRKSCGGARARTRQPARRWSESTAKYSTNTHRMQELDLIWANAILYNGANHNVGKAAARLRKRAALELDKAGLTGAGALPVVVLCYRSAFSACLSARRARG